MNSKYIDFYPPSETEVVYDYNNSEPSLKPVFCLDPINVFDLKGNLIGYT